ncbi:GNAT family N-acetyltransferase [Azospirillum oryzae]|uniref:GNAT family N-acetyltransferase n=1 Tax=Azospirillum oryzae TaxID=286727 RepID=A0A6N1AI63_9PROT|nr:GNAT family N-acetyltransferase [Azospirillum oryzae]KAA0586073.1 GNAT family N-acetyltransferase [Azospirillum oryzae]QKS50949.1 GNAT family N-acetyltransferase [Azospirillum oryzae]GLR79223.1 N-acetyltransferase [Azospirillum oryzae]
MAEIAIDKVDALKTADLHDLCDAADDAIRAGGGFGWVEPPPRDVMERFWKGVLVVPERVLFVARLDGVVAGSAQLVKPPRNNEAQAHAAQLTTSFVAPWARGHGLARRLTLAVVEEARAVGFRVLNLDVRVTQEAAIALYESLGFRRWGTHPFYALVQGQPLAGHFYCKDLQPDSPPPAE